MSWLTVIVDFPGFDEASREKASSEECRPVCTRKPKPSPRGVAGRLAEKPHLTWEDTGIWNEAWPGGPGEVAPGPGPAVLLSHVCRCWLPPNQTGVGGEGQRRSLPGEESWGLSPLCTPTYAGRRLLQRRGLGLWQGFSGLVLGYSESLEPLSSDPWLEALPKLLSPPTDLSDTSY